MTRSSSACASWPCCSQCTSEPRIDVAEPRSHHEAAGRREAHGRVDRPPVAHGRHARAVAQVREHRAPERRRAHLGDDVLVRQTVEAVPAQARAVVPFGQRVALGDRRERAVKRGVEARRPAAGPATARPPPRSPRSPAGRCSGAKGVSSRSESSSAPFTRAGADSCAPPCTMRCPTASGSGSPRRSISSRSARTAAAWSRRRRARCDRRSPRAHLLARCPLAGSTSKRAYLSDDEPQLIDRTLIGGPRVESTPYALRGSAILPALPAHSRPVQFEIAHEFDIPLDALELAVVSPSLVDKLGAKVRELGGGIETIRERTRSWKDGVLERVWHYQANIRIPQFARAYVTREMCAWDEQSVYQMSRHRGSLDHHAQREARVAQVLLVGRHVRDPAARRRPLAAGRQGASSSCACASFARWPRGSSSPRSRRRSRPRRRRCATWQRSSDCEANTMRLTRRRSAVGLAGLGFLAALAVATGARPIPFRRAPSTSRRPGAASPPTTRRDAIVLNPANLAWLPARRAPLDVGELPGRRDQGRLRHGLGGGDPPALRPGDRPAGRPRRAALGRPRERGNRLPLPRQQLRVGHLGGRAQALGPRVLRDVARALVLAERVRRRPLGRQRGPVVPAGPAPRLLGGRARLQRAEPGARCRRSRTSARRSPCSTAATRWRWRCGRPAGGRRSRLRDAVLPGLESSGSRAARWASTCRRRARLRERRDRAPAQRQRARRARHRGARAALRRPERRRRRALRQRLRRLRRAST